LIILAKINRNDKIIMITKDTLKANGKPAGINNQDDTVDTAPSI
jgi:hypothetical protein